MWAFPLVSVSTVIAGVGLPHYHHAAMPMLAGLAGAVVAAAGSAGREP